VGEEEELAARIGAWWATGRAGRAGLDRTSSAAAIVETKLSKDIPHTQFP
jgi:hypothetical protein